MSSWYWKWDLAFLTHGSQSATVIKQTVVCRLIKQNSLKLQKVQRKKWKSSWPKAPSLSNVLLVLLWFEHVLKQQEEFRCDMEIWLSDWLLRLESEGVCSGEVGERQQGIYRVSPGVSGLKTSSAFPERKYQTWWFSLTISVFVYLLFNPETSPTQFSYFDVNLHKIKFDTWM